MDLHCQRQYHASGPQPISHSDFASFCFSTQGIPKQVLPKFKRVVSALDALYLNHYHESNK